MSANEEKARQLGMSHGTASGQLKKSIMLHLLQRLGEDVCFKCGKRIETPKELSVEHIIPWLHNDSKLFWDLDNIAFSHRRCNKPNRPGLGQRVIAPKGMSWCTACKTFKPIKEFSKKSSRWNGLYYWCRSCRSTKRKKVKRVKSKQLKICKNCGQSENKVAMKQNRQLCKRCYNTSQRKVMRERRAIRLA